jgi:hypothetical protein
MTKIAADEIEGISVMIGGVGEGNDGWRHLAKSCLVLKKAVVPRRRRKDSMLADMSD